MGNRFRIVVRTEEDISDSGRGGVPRLRRGEDAQLLRVPEVRLRGMVNHRVGQGDTGAGLPGGGADLPRGAAGKGGRRGGARRGGSPARNASERRTTLLSPGRTSRGGSPRDSRRSPTTTSVRSGGSRSSPRRLFVQSYQSYLFNLTLSEAVRAGLRLSQRREGGQLGRG